jgi:hypothetical protein
MYKSLTLLLIAIAAFYMGYNYLFNTEKVIAKHLSQYREGSWLHKLLSGSSNFLRLKVIGAFIILFAIMLIWATIVLIVKKRG